jgi:3-keto-L-gulonate-6-phosphate decarboxylase
MTEHTSGQLDADSLRMMRKAGQVVFRVHNGVGTIESSDSAITRNASGKEWTHILTVATKSTVYDNQNCSYRYKVDSAFEMIHSAKYCEVWQTVLAILRAGDVVSLHWLANAERNQYAEGASLHVDTLQLDVKRGKRVLSFAIAHSVNPGNTARMVKPTLKPEYANA